MSVAKDKMVLSLGRQFIEGVRPPRRRTFLEFAEQELVLVDGPRSGLKFRSSFMAFTRLILCEYDLLRYRRFFLTAGAQMGKTVIGFILPAMYHLFEMEENVILGGPTVELAQSIYQDRLLPSIKVSQYARLLPRKGAGSRGGRTLSIRFRHGAVLRFMGAGGGDEQRSSHPARVVILTEIDKMDTPGKASRESDPVSQLEARADAFAEQAIIYGECTMSTERGRINREVNHVGTGSTPYFRCPECTVPVPLEREHFHGWEEASDVLAAIAGAHYVCPSCSAKWDEAARAAALQKPVLVSKGQTIGKDGELEGEPPATNTFGFRWTALASALRTMGSIADKESRAETGNDEDRRAIFQFIWAKPYSGELADLSRVEVETVLSKMVKHERGAIPSTTKLMTLAIDVGSYVCWWTLFAWTKDAQGHVVDFGSIDVPQTGEGKSKLAVLAALRAFRDNTIKPGWNGRQPDRIIVDAGYESDVVYSFVLESGQGRYLASKGFGSKSRNGPFRSARTSSPTRQVGDDWIVSVQPAGVALIEINSDRWKAAVHDGFGLPQGAPGSLTLFARPRTDPAIRIFARQICAEYREVDPTPNTQHGYRWVVASRQNHYLDCASMARVAADILGIKVIEPAPPAPKKEQARSEQRQSRKIRTQYT